MYINNKKAPNILRLDIKGIIFSPGGWYSAVTTIMNKENILNITNVIFLYNSLFVLLIKYPNIIKEPIISNNITETIPNWFSPLLKFVFFPSTSTFFEKLVILFTPEYINWLKNNKRANISIILFAFIYK